MAHWIVVGGPDIYETTKEMGFTRHGFKSTRRKMAGRIQPGDRMIFYITGKKQFAGAVKITSTMAEEDTRIWESKKKPEEMYPYRVDIEAETVLEEGDWIDAQPYHERMSWTQKWPSKNWTLAYQGNLHEIPEDDFEILAADLKAARSAVKS